MIRFMGAFFIAALMLGSVALCQWYLTRDVEFSVARKADAEEGPAPSSEAPVFSLVLTPGFNAVDDPFALRMGNTKSPRLLVKQADHLLLQHEADVNEGVPVALTNIAFTGDSVSLYVEGSPSPEDAVRPCALRVQVFRKGALCDDQTLWSEGGGTKPGAAVTLSLIPRLKTLDRGIGGAQ